VFGFAALLDEKLGGGVNCMPGLAGRTTGGWMKLAV
jgi:hypothetical protein